MGDVLSVFFGAERTGSRICGRAISFTRCVLAREPNPFKIGDPVCGILEHFGSADPVSSQISGSGFPTFSTWEIACARMFPPFLELAAAAIYEIPMLEGRRFSARATRPDRRWGWILNLDRAPWAVGPRIPVHPRPDSARQRSKSARLAENQENSDRGKSQPPSMKEHRAPARKASVAPPRKTGS